MKQIFIVGAPVKRGRKMENRGERESERERVYKSLDGSTIDKRIKTRCAALGPGARQCDQKRRQFYAAERANLVTLKLLSRQQQMEGKNK